MQHGRSMVDDAIAVEIDESSECQNFTQFYWADLPPLAVAAAVNHSSEGDAREDEKMLAAAGWDFDSYG